MQAAEDELRSTLQARQRAEQSCQLATPHFDAPRLKVELESALGVQCGGPPSVGRQLCASMPQVEDMPAPCMLVHAGGGQRRGCGPARGGGWLRSAVPLPAPHRWVGQRDSAWGMQLAAVCCGLCSCLLLSPAHHLSSTHTGSLSVQQQPRLMRHASLPAPQTRCRCPRHDGVRGVRRARCLPGCV